MNSKLKLAMAASAIALLAGCEANGGFPGGGNPGGPGGPGPGDPGFIDLGGTLTLLPGWTITRRASGTAEEIQSGVVCELEDQLLAVLLGGQGLCYVNNAVVNTNTVPPVNTVDQNAETYSVVNLVATLLDDPTGLVPSIPNPVGGNGNSLVASAGVGVDLSSNVSAGNVAAFDVQIPPGTVTADVLRDATIRTFLNGEPQEIYAGLQILGIDLLGLDLLSFVGDTHFLLGCVNTLPYDRIEIEAGGVVSATAVDLNGDLPSGTDNLLDFVSGEALYIWDVVTGAAAPEGIDATDPAYQCTPAQGF